MASIIPTPVQLIEKKRNKEELTKSEIEAFVHYVTGTGGLERMDDVQLGAMLMAVYINGLTIDEAVSLTLAMKHSGECLQWDQDNIFVDKHSVGGVGDKVSIPLAPLLASIPGVKVPMISGRGLGHTGGTLDKLESLPGFNASKTTEQFQQAVNQVGCSIIGTTENIVPADRILYKSRDISGTIFCNGMVYASVLSKKAAEGAKHLVVDLKLGSGCWLDSREKAEKALIDFEKIGQILGINCTCMITRMDWPIGFSVGNSLELIESVDFLKTKATRNKDLEDLVLYQGAVLLKSSNLFKTVEEAKEALMEKLDSGEALAKFEEMLVSSDVPKDIAHKLCSFDDDCYKHLPKAKFQHPILAQKTGVISRMEAKPIGLACNALGAGRKKSSDKLNYAVGLVISKHIGDNVNKGDQIATLHADVDINEAAIQIEQIDNAITISPLNENYVKPNIIVKF